MDTARKIIGLLLIIFFGLPSLFGIIWAVGMIKASVSPEFLTDLPREIIAEAPDLADEIFRAAQDEEVIANNNTRAWFQAAAKTGISPKELMAKTGLLDWMEGELSDSLRQIGRVLRGERRPRSIVIDMRPLKEALLHPEVDRFLEETLNQLPPCDEAGERAWMDLEDWSHGHREIPACRPDFSLANEALYRERAEAVEDIDNEIEVFEDIHPFPLFPFGISGTITFFSYFLFLIPAAFIFIGAIIAASSPAGVLRWSGGSILAGGIPALLLALASKYLSLWAIRVLPYSWHEEWTSEFGDLVLDKLRWISMRIVDQLFSPVIGIALIVCVVGIVFIALSYSARSTRKTQTPVPSSPQVTAKTEAPKSDQSAQSEMKVAETPKPEEQGEK